MVAKWHKVKMLKHDSFKLILDSLRARNGFIWRPYKNSPPLELYNEKDMWACNNPNYFDELESFARCLRVSVVRDGLGHSWYANTFNENPWISYSQPVIDKNLYTALRAWHASHACHQPNVTSGYYHWWNQSNPSKEGDIHDGCVVSSSEHLLPTLSSGKKEGGGSDDPPPDFTSKFKREQGENFDEVGKCWKWRGFVYSPLYVVSPSSRVEGARSVNGNDNGVKIKNSSCDTDDVRDKEGEDASHRIVGIASNFESRIEKLERVIAKLEAAKNGQRVQNTGVKAKPSAP
ncbi:hypothetical protein JHK85_023628 [Glycine max]|nr:hypothetical protein JHK85_023628 [Glycine max]